MRKTLARFTANPRKATNTSDLLTSILETDSTDWLTALASVQPGIAPTNSGAPAGAAGAGSNFASFAPGNGPGSSTPAPNMFDPGESLDSDLLDAVAAGVDQGDGAEESGGGTARLSAATSGPTAGRRKPLVVSSRGGRGTPRSGFAGASFGGGGCAVWDLPGFSSNTLPRTDDGSTEGVFRIVRRPLSGQ